MKKLIKGIIKLVLMYIIFTNIKPALHYVMDCYVAAKAYNEFQGSSLEPRAAVEPEMVNTEFIDIVVPEIDVNIAELSESYSDFIGMLYIPACDIMLPMMQGEDNEYYLHHTYDGKESSVGSIFMSHFGALTNENSIVYGHNMKSGQAFGKLDKLMDSEDKMIYLYTVDGTYCYKAFAGEFCTTDSLLYSVVDAENHDAYVNYAIENSTMTNVSEIETVGRMLTFSTCHGAAGGNQRLVINAGLIGIF